MPFPQHRPRRLRRTESIRQMVQETHLRVDQLVMPLFVRSGNNVRKAIDSMPGQFQLSVDEAVKLSASAVETGIKSFILFGIPDEKDPVGTSGLDPEGPVPQAVRELKKALPETNVITDVCLCEYTDHGHCGIIKDDDVDNDITLEQLARMALVHARAGADMLAPSDMMDGRIGHIRQALDAQDLGNIALMSYAAKYASSFYGPFRDAAESPPRFGDRRGYQMDPANSLEALREVSLDIEEGADIVMVKPALPYLDIIRMVQDNFDVPVAAYNVSGEYAMIKAAAANGWLDERGAVMESLLSMRRAGADIIITYWALDVAEWLME